jgi:WD40 repeat protein
LALNGCFLADSSPSSSETGSADPDPQSANVKATSAGQTNSSGRLAYIGGDGNVYVTAVGSASTMTVTNDATTLAEGEGLSYHRISWSRDGRLAFASVERSLGQAQSKLYVAQTPGGKARLVAESDDHFVIYVYWSPVMCGEQPDCYDLAYLIEENKGIALRAVAMNGGQVRNQRLGVGGPVYFSWSADGRQIVWHTGGRFNTEPRLVLQELAPQRAQTVSPSPGGFLAPAWSPQGEGWLGVTAAAEQGERNRWQRFGSDQSDVLLTTDKRQITFVWSPAGDRVAYATGEEENGVVYGPIHLYNLSTGQTRQITGNTFLIEGFFWSPNGQRIGYLTRPTMAGQRMQWRVYDLEQDQDRGFTMFEPSQQMRFVSSSFSQYAQSHRFWSPDGRYLAYADRDGELRERVWLIDTWAEANSEPILIDEGSIAFWSWE